VDVRELLRGDALALGFQISDLPADHSRLCADGTGQFGDDATTFGVGVRWDFGR
jgi:uncharacterized membrane-anchored protein